MEDWHATTRSFCIGCPHYLSPEIIRKSGHGLATDWWGLGCLIYELVVGIPPFYVNDPPQPGGENPLYTAILHRTLLFPPNVTHEFRDICTRLLAKDSDERMGCRKGFLEVKDHPWFSSINWIAMMKKEIKSPFLPKPVENENDYSNFSPEFVKDEKTMDNFLNEKDVKELPSDFVDPWEYFPFNYTL